MLSSKLQSGQGSAVAKRTCRRRAVIMDTAAPAATTQMTSTQFLRPHMLKLAPYTPIEPFEILSQRYGRTPEQIIKLDANENPYGPPPEVRKALAEMPYPHIYPDPETRRLRKALAEMHNIPMEHLLVCPWAWAWVAGLAWVPWHMHGASVSVCLVCPACSSVVGGPVSEVVELERWLQQLHTAHAWRGRHAWHAVDGHTRQALLEADEAPASRQYGINTALTDLDLTSPATCSKIFPLQCTDVRACNQAAIHLTAPALDASPCSNIEYLRLHAQVGCGADELIDLLMRCVLEPGEKIIDCPPTFTMCVCSCAATA